MTRATMAAVLTACGLLPAARAQVPAPVPAPPVNAAPAAPAAPLPWANKLFLDDILRNPAQAAPPVILKDFGRVPQGTVCVHKFTLTNIYDVPMQVVEVRKSCTCLDYAGPPGAIPPNKTGEFTVTMNTGKFTGANAQTFYVTVGPKFVSTAVIRVQATSDPVVTLNPGAVHFGTVALGSKSTPQVVMVQHHRQRQLTSEWKLELVKPNGPLTAELAPPERGFLGVGGNGGWRLTVAVKPDAPPGPLAETLTLKTTDPANPVLHVGVTGTVQAPLDIFPTRVRLDAIEVGKTGSVRVMLRAAKPFKVLAAEGGGAGVGVELPPSGTALPVQFVTVGFTPTAPGPVSKSVRLKTDLDGGTIVTLPVEAEGIPPAADEPGLKPVGGRN